MIGDIYKFSLRYSIWDVSIRWNSLKNHTKKFLKLDSHIDTEISFTIIKDAEFIGNENM